jgi:hypothetical protein
MHLFVLVGGHGQLVAVEHVAALLVNSVHVVGAEQVPALGVSEAITSRASATEANV